MDLFASRNSCQSTRLEDQTKFVRSGDKCIATRMVKSVSVYLPTFLLINRALTKIEHKMLLATPAWPSISWYPTILGMAIEQPLILPQDHQFLVNPQQKPHPLVINKSLKLMVWTVSGFGYLREEFQRQFPNLCQISDSQAHWQITIRPGSDGLAGVVQEKLIHFGVI